MTLSEVIYACVVIRRQFYHPITIPGVADHHVLFHVVVSVPETFGNIPKQFNPFGSLHFHSQIQDFPDLQAAPRSRPDFFPTSKLPFLPTLSQGPANSKVGLYFLCTCSFIDNVILTDCNRHLLPPKPSRSYIPSSPTVQVTPDFIPLTYVILIMSCLDQFENKSRKGNSTRAF